MKIIYVVAFYFVQIKGFEFSQIKQRFTETRNREYCINVLYICIYYVNVVKSILLLLLGLENERKWACYKNYYHKQSKLFEFDLWFILITTLMLQQLTIYGLLVSLTIFFSVYYSFISTSVDIQTYILN